MSTNKKINYITKIILIFSIPFLTLLLSYIENKTHILIGVLLSFIIGTIVVIKKIKLEKLNILKFIISIMISLYTIKKFLLYSNNNIDLINIIFEKVINKTFEISLLTKLIGILALPSTIYLIYIFIIKSTKFIKEFIKRLSKTDRTYMKIMIILSVIISLTLTTLTSAFSKPYYKGEIVAYDVIYTSDTGAITLQDAFFNINHSENDIRQPLFGIFSLPFSIPAKIISELCFFLPNNFEYEIILTIIQFIIITSTTIMLANILKIDEKDKKYFYMLFSVSFPYIIFNVLLEQYAIALFYLILAFYINDEHKKEINYMYIGAVGTLLTSGIIFPIISKFKNIKLYITNLFKCFLSFVSVLIIGGQFYQIPKSLETIKILSVYAGKNPLYDRFCQLTHFIKSIFFSQKGHFQIFNDHISYQLIKYNNISIIGVIILIALTISFIINRKNKIALISYLWVLFSIIILCIVGWGAPENGLILYSLYFGWSYLILYYLLIKKIFKKRSYFITTMTLTIVIMIITNGTEFINILKFAIKYFGSTLIL